MTQHTPGPWKIEERTRRIVANVQGETVTVVTGPGVLGGANPYADARLITAAPRMLASLRAILTQHCEHWEIIDKLNQRTGDCLCAVCQEARAVLRDVEGESNA